MAVATSTGTKGTEAGSAVTHLAYRADNTRPAVLWAHGRGGSGVNETQIADNFRVMNGVSCGNYPILSMDMGGQTTWGNDTAIAKVTDAKTYAQGTLGGKAGKVLLWGGSMGSLVVLNWAAANPTLVAAVACALPANSLVDLHDNNRGGFKTEIETAHGTGVLASFVGNATATAHDPTQQAANLISFPIKLWYSTDDTTVVPSTVTAFQTAVNTAGGNCQIQSMGAIGHTITAIDETQVLRFFQANA
jgi:predicted esterase